MFAIRTYNVLKVDNAYKTTIQELKGERSRYKLLVRFTMPTIQRRRNFKVDVHLAKL